MGEVKRFRKAKRLKSLDELPGPIWKWETIETRPVLVLWPVAAGLIIGVLIGLALIAL